jgi:DNA-directed RNA polymerase specialized sigma24 family protein
MFTLDPAVTSCKVPYMDQDELYSIQAKARKNLSKGGAELDIALEEVQRRKDRLRVDVRLAHQFGLTEVEIANLAGISRPTVRDWLGKT